MNRKLDLLQILAGTVCPICQQPKAAQGWTCLTCGKAYRGSPEHADLKRACDAHMVAADRYLTMIQEQRDV